MTSYFQTLASCSELSVNLENLKIVILENAFGALIKMWSLTNGLPDPCRAAAYAFSRMTILLWVESYYPAPLYVYLQQAYTWTSRIREPFNKALTAIID